MLFLKAGIQNYQVLYHYHGESSAGDTRQAAMAFKNAGVDLVFFAGVTGLPAISLM